jgi:DNA-binding XRE family transcriptional regulator
MDIKPVRCRIPEILKEKRRTQVWLADQVDITPSYLSDLIHLRFNPGIEICAKIAYVLKVHIDDLYVWEWHGE